MALTRLNPNPRVHWPIVLILGEVAILALIWGFFITTSLKPLPLSDSLADAVKNNPQTTSLVVTFIATLLSGTIWYLFCKSVCFAINVQLTNAGLSLHSLSSLTAIANGGFIWGHLASLWTYIAFVIAIAFLIQTAALTAVLTPSMVNLTYPISGQELDLTSPDFPKLLGPLTHDWSTDPAIQPDTQYTVIPAVTSSGEMAVRARLSLPSFFSFNNYSYVGSTYGVLPANLVPMSNVLPSTKEPDTFLPANTRITQKPKYRGLDTSYKVTQQGFIPNVKCRPQTVDIDVEYFADSQKLVATTICPNTHNVSVSLLTASDRSALFVFGCSVFTDEYPTAPPAEYDIILKGHGRLYGSLPAYICRVNSDVVSLDINYDNPPMLFNTKELNLLNATFIQEKRVAVPRMGWEAVTVFLRQITSTQSLYASTVGNIISSFYQMRYSDADSMTGIWEAYLQGSLEFASTLVRTNITSRGRPDVNIAQDNLTMPLRTVNGTFKVETMGWTQSSEIAHRATFLAPSFILLSALLVVIVSAIRSIISPRIPVVGSTSFDANDTLHVVAAAAAGDLDVQPDYANDGVPNAKALGVRLDAAGGKVGFVASRAIQGGYMAVEGEKLIT